MLAATNKEMIRVCVVGAGPAGFYAAMNLTKNLPAVQVDLIEKLPVPFGLIRYGVAPDHPEVKNVINQFTKVAKQSNVNFYGNISVGKDIRISELRKHYDAVLLSYGADEDKCFGIENEHNTQNVMAARNFVGWYNGLPSAKDLKIDLSGPTAAILGQGNVALDVARILLTPIDILKKTDITEHALNILGESKIKELYLIGRRGPLQVAFTIKELREMLKLPNCKTIWKSNDFAGVDDVTKDLPRPRKRLTELMLKSLNEKFVVNRNDNFTYFKPVFFRNPSKFLVDNQNKLSGIELSCTKLIGDKIEEQRCVNTDKKEILNCNIAFRSIGYKSISVDNDLVFTPSGIVANEGGRVICDKVKENGGKLYVAGWLGTGPVGVILYTMGNAFQVAKTMCEDLKNNRGSDKGGYEEVKHILKKKNIQTVDWEGWEKIDQYETLSGQKKGKPREKICSIEKMLEVAK